MRARPQLQEVPVVVLHAALLQLLHLFAVVGLVAVLNPPVLRCLVVIDL